MNPVISTASDRHRGRLGRRMPFMLYTAPFIALFLAAFAYAGPIAAGLNAHLPAVAHGVGWVAAHVLPGSGRLGAEARLTLAVVAGLMALFRLADLFPQCVYYYLFADVIPQTVMGTFICLFAVTSTVGTILFHSLLLPVAVAHPRLVYGVSAGLFLVTFTLLPLVVEEGQYPPPPPRPKGRPLALVLAWAGEMFTRPFYWKYFLGYSAFRWAFSPFNAFLIVYAQRRLNLGPAAFGHLMAVVLTVQMPALFLLGPVLDRFHPTRVAVAGFAMLAVSAAAGFWLIDGRGTFVGCTIATFLSVAVIQNALQTMGPRVLPVERYGQFSSANSMVSETGMLFLAYACGRLLDRMGQPYLFAWLGGFAVLGLVMTTSLYRAWLARGGDAAYTPPAVG